MPYLQCNDMDRAAKWIDAVGDVRLPVLPEPTMVNGELCYMVDMRRLTRDQRDRMAQQITVWFNASLDDVMFQMTQFGVPVPVRDCVLVDDEMEIDNG